MSLKTTTPPTPSRRETRGTTISSRRYVSSSAPLSPLIARNIIGKDDAENLKTFMLSTSEGINLLANSILVLTSSAASSISMSSSNVRVMVAISLSHVASISLRPGITPKDLSSGSTTNFSSSSGPAPGYTATTEIAGKETGGKKSRGIFLNATSETTKKEIHIITVDIGRLTEISVSHTLEISSFPLF